MAPSGIMSVTCRKTEEKFSQKHVTTSQSRLKEKWAEQTKLVKGDRGAES